MEDDIIQMLVRHEGYRQFPYYDTTGHLTIGIGRNLKDRGISRAEAIYMLKNDIDDCRQELSEGLFWFDDAPEKVQDVLIDMCFNLGYAGLMTFKNSLENIKNGDYKIAADNLMKSKWANQVGARAKELTDILKSL